MIETTLGMIRHAETRWNREKRIQGQTDSPLTRTGRSQASAWGRRLADQHWDCLLSSDLERSVDTAGQINAVLKLPLETEPGLREQDWGSWTGQTVLQLRQEMPGELAVQEQAGWNFCPPGGERREDVWHRTRQALVTAGGRWPGGRILVGCHAGVIKALIYRLCRRAFLPSEPPLIAPFHLHLLRCKGEALVLDTVNALALEPKTPGSEWRDGK